MNGQWWIFTPEYKQWIQVDSYRALTVKSMMASFPAKYEGYKVVWIEPNDSFVFVPSIVIF